MKKFVQSTDPVVKSAMNDEEIVAKASLCEEKDITSLIKGEEEDETKDQSYVLFNLNQKIMKKLKLPIGTYSKIKIREIASEFELINCVSSSLSVYNGLIFSTINPAFKIPKVLIGYCKRFGIIIAIEDFFVKLRLLIF